VCAAPADFCVKKKSMKLINNNITIFIILLISIITACAGKDARNYKPYLVGGLCEYKEIMGTAVISSIADANSDDLNCDNEPVEVLFNFMPDDLNAKDDYLFPNISDSNQKIKLGEGLNPSKDYMNIKGIIKGTSHKCIRKEIVKGTCTPVLYEFSQIDFSDYGEYCW